LRSGSEVSTCHGGLGKKKSGGSEPVFTWLGKPSFVKKQGVHKKEGKGFCQRNADRKFRRREQLSCHGPNAKGEKGRWAVKTACARTTSG